MNPAAWLLLATAAAALLALAGLWWQRRVWRREHRRWQAELTELRDALARQEDEARSQQAIVFGLGDHLQGVEKRLRKLEAQRLSLPAAGGDKSYQQAVRMLRDGFGDREIIDLCGITQGELTLIKNLHRTGALD